MLDDTLTAEECVASRLTAVRNEYSHLGLGAAPPLGLVDKATPLHTADARLANAALHVNWNSINFSWTRGDWEPTCSA